MRVTATIDRGGQSNVQKIMRAPSQVVPDYLRGLAAANPGVLVHDVEHGIVTRPSPAVQGKVGLVSGGGSGCEPLHAGFVGVGMLDAACPGEVFSSPVPRQILAATEYADTGAGVVYVVKNYGGEVMNFGLSSEIMRRRDKRIETVLVNDDVSMPAELRGRRRGLGATLLVEKIAGAAAEQGREIEGVADVARRVAAQSRSFGVALSSCTHPATGDQTFQLPGGQYEVGVGLGGDRGQERCPLPDADGIADLLVEKVASALSVRADRRVLVLLSGLGSTPNIELYGLYGLLVSRLAEINVEVHRSLVGNYVTSLDTLGAALTLLELDDELIDLWDSPVHTASLRWGV